VVLDGEAMCFTGGMHDFDQLWGNCFDDTMRLCAFDLLEFDGEDYRAKPLAERRSVPRDQPSLTHFLTKLFFAAPASGLPSLLTAAVSQHFLIALVLAAPASGLPSLLSALVAHDCANAPLVEKDTTRSARASRFMKAILQCNVRPKS